MLPCLLRRWFARFKLCAHPLEARGKRFNSLLLLSRTRFQCLNFAMLFEKLVEQHRVHLVVAHAVGFSLFVPHDQVWIHFFYLLGHQSELRCARCVNFLLVTEGNRLKGQERFAGFLHWFDLLLKPRRGGKSAELTGIVDKDRGASSRGRVKDAPDVTGVALANNAAHTEANIDVIRTRRCTGPGSSP